MHATCHRYYMMMEKVVCVCVCVYVCVYVCLCVCMYVYVC